VLGGIKRSSFSTLEIDIMFGKMREVTDIRKVYCIMVIFVLEMMQI